MNETMKNLTQSALTRRGFLATAGAASAATLIGCGSSGTPKSPPIVPPTSTPLTDVDVLNFALNLEYLEAEFYLRAATGAGIPTADMAGGVAAVVPATTKVDFSSSPLFQQIANELAQTELQHVRAIQATIKALGGTPVPMPKIDYVAGFAAVAAAAKLTSFNPFADPFSFFVGALTFEDVGVTAYTGAATLLSNATVLSAAAGIQAAEAYHAGALRTILVGGAIAAGSTTYLDDYNAISGVRATLGGGNETPLMTGISGTTVGPSSIVAADSTNSLAFPRTTDQVLHIVYASSTAVSTSGGFFPAGVNGNIKATAS